VIEAMLGWVSNSARFEAALAPLQSVKKRAVGA
jgi:hypothetical protein